MQTGLIQQSFRSFAVAIAIQTASGPGGAMNAWTAAINTKRSLSRRFAYKYGQLPNEEAIWRACL